ncbi:MAG: MFS transporter, partial [Deltaproteobacteria bacterium]|nr:MFS transporter [Deltaproteobacteria bacterium]
MRALKEHFLATTQGLPRAFWMIWAGLLINRLGCFVLAFLATYLVRERGLDAAGAGRVVAIYGLGIVLSGPVGGTLADKVGRRGTMLVGLVGGGLSVVALTLTTSIPVMTGLAFVSGLVGELYRPAMNAAVADLVPVADRQRAYGLVYWAVNFGLAVGWLLGSALATSGVRILFFADAITSFACAGLILSQVPETRPVGLVHQPVVRGMLRTLGDGPFAVFLALHVVSLVVFCQWQLGLPLDMAAHGLSPSVYGVLMGVNCVEVVVLQPILSHRLRHKDAGSMLALMALLLGIGYGVNAFGGTL